MILIKPANKEEYSCDCGGKLVYSELLWQGLHICHKYVCEGCNKILIKSVPVNQAVIEQYSYFPGSGVLLDAENKEVPENWFSSKLKNFANPAYGRIELEIEVLKKSDEIIILNTLDYVYGHSLLFLLNLQRLIRSDDKPGIVVLVQPMMKWLVPKSFVAEIWTVKLGFEAMKSYYPDLSERINNELGRFRKVCLSKGYPIPTNENIEIENFTGIKPYDFKNKENKPAITFIWREDPDRLWIRNIYLLKGLKKLGFRRILIPFHYLRVIRLFRLIHKRLGNNYRYIVAGPGKSFKMPSYIEDKRFLSFNEEIERDLCRLYAGSELVIGVHGSSMLLPSAHAGMALSLMPSKRWGNFAEDILFNETDPRLASFQRRVVPLNLSIFEIRDIVVDMITGRDYFIKKFIHSDEL